MKQLTAVLLLASLAAVNSTAASLPEPSQSVLSSGKWVKIRIDESGAYQLTDAELRSLGFNNPSQVKVYGYTPTLLLTHDTSLIPTDLSIVPSVHENDKLAFYAQSNVSLNPELWGTTISYKNVEHDRHAFGNGASYFLTETPVCAFMSQIEAPSAVTGSELSSHQSVIFHEQDLVNPGMAGSVIVGEQFVNRTTRLPFTLTLSKVSNSSARMHFQTAMISSSNSKNYAMAEYPQGWLCDDSAGEAASSLGSYGNFGMSRRTQPLTIPVHDLPEQYEIVFTPHPEISTGFSRGYMDYWALIYNRKNDLSYESQMMMYFPEQASNGFLLSGFAEGDSWHVWDVTDPTDVRECVLTQGVTPAQKVGQYAIGSASAPAAVIAFNTAATLPTPQIVGSVANQNLHGLATPDMVIVTSALLKDAAEQAADVHRRLQGYDVAVIDQEQIFNEYGSGNVSPEAVRLFMRHLWLKNPQKLKALMLVGPATANNAASVYPGSPTVVTLQNESYERSIQNTTNFFSDAFYGHLEEKRNNASYKPLYQVMLNPQTIGVGRLPFSSSSAIRDYMAKVEDYIANPPVVPVMGNVIASADLGKLHDKDGYHYADTEKCIAKYGEALDGDVTATRIYSNFYSSAKNEMPRRWMTSALTRGAELMVFFGHGTAGLIGGNIGSDYFLDMAKAAKLNNAGSYTFGFFGSCNVARHDSQSENLASTIVGNPSGGLIGLVACCREGFIEKNPIMGRAFVDEFAKAPNGELIGDVFKRALDAVVGSTSIITDISNYLCYGYTGDPALPLYRSTHTLTLDPLNSTNTILPGVANTISGSVTDSEGKVDTGFNGTALVTVYDAAETRPNVKLWNKGETEELTSMQMDHNALLQVSVPVVNGRFTAKFNGPGITSADRGTITYANSIRVTGYAYSSDKQSRALGHIKGVTQGDVPSDATPIIYSDPVQIVDFSVADAEIDGSVSGRVLLHAEISAPQGLNVGNAGFAPARLTIDGKSLSDATRALKYVAPGVYELNYLTAEMGDGRHEAALDIMGLDGEICTRQIEFSVNNTASVAADVATSDDGKLTVNFSVSNVDRSYVCVETLSGQMVKRIPTTDSSVTVSDLMPGIYRVYTQHESTNVHTSSAKQTVTIL